MKKYVLVKLKLEFSSNELHLFDLTKWDPGFLDHGHNNILTYKTLTLV